MNGFYWDGVTKSYVPYPRGFDLNLSSELDAEVDPTQSPESLLTRAENNDCVTVGGGRGRRGRRGREAEGSED